MSPQRTACFNSLEGLKRGIRPSTVTVCPVFGLRRVRARRRATENVPKPTNVTGSQRLRDVRIEDRMARIARSGAAFVHPAAVAMMAMMSHAVMLVTIDQ